MDLSKFILTTKRLGFRTLLPDDAKFLFEYRSDPEVARFQGWKPSSSEEALAFINRNQKTALNTPETWAQLGIVELETGRLVGDFGLHFLEEGNPQCEIGYTVAPKFQGNGYGSEAIRGVLSFLFDTLNKHRVFASVDPANTASWRVLEKAKLKKEAHFKKSLLFKGVWVDDVIYAVLKEDFY